MRDYIYDAFRTLDEINKEENVNKPKRLKEKLNKKTKLKEAVEGDRRWVWDTAHKIKHLEVFEDGKWISYDNEQDYENSKKEEDKLKDLNEEIELKKDSLFKQEIDKLHKELRQKKVKLKDICDEKDCNYNLYNQLYETLSIRKDISRDDALNTIINNIKSQNSLKESLNYLTSIIPTNLIKLNKQLSNRLSYLKESLNLNILYRIYINDSEIGEDFIDDNWTDEDEIINYAKDLASNSDTVIKVAVLKLDDDDNLNILWENETPNEYTENKEEDSLKPLNLNESKAFNLKDINDVENGKIYSKLNEEEKENELIAIDPSYESENPENRAQVGDALLECSVCKSIITFKVDDLEKDEDTDLYNMEFSCPHCGAKAGFNYVAQLGKPLTKETEEENTVDNLEVEEDKSDDDIELDEIPDSDLNEDDLELEDTLIESLNEKCFDEKVKEYLNENFKNIKDYKSDSIVYKNNNFYIKGSILHESGKKSASEFVLTPNTNNANKQVILEGYNNYITKDNKAFKFSGKVANREFITESLKYNYNITKNKKQFKVTN